MRKESDRALAAGYFRQQLAQGKSLAKLLLASVAFEGGDVAALSAVVLNPNEATQFESGHTVATDSQLQRVAIGEMNLRGYPVPSTVGQLGEAIYALLSDPDDLCLLENSLAEPSDPWMKRAKSRLLFHDTEVYHAIFGVERDKARIANAVREAEHPRVFVGAVGRVPSGMGCDLVSISTVTADQLAQFAKTVLSVFVRAYDGEGYLVWTRSPA
ncbi:MAG: hypothetical protein ACRD4X_14730 [Candidatus Acidiferrales bacterium]